MTTESLPLVWCQKEEKSQAYLRQEDSHVPAVSVQNEIGVNMVSHRVSFVMLTMTLFPVAYVVYVAVVSLQKKIGVNELFPVTYVTCALAVSLLSMVGDNYCLYTRFFFNWSPAIVAWVTPNYCSINSLTPSVTSKRDGRQRLVSSAVNQLPTMMISGEVLLSKQGVPQ